MIITVFAVVIFVLTVGAVSMKLKRANVQEAVEPGKSVSAQKKSVF